MNGVAAGLLKRHDIDVRWRGQNALSGLNFPVAGIDDAHSGGYRAFHSCHQINPLPNACILFEEARIDHVHAAGIRNVVVDHDHFAVLAQVHPA